MAGRETVATIGGKRSRFLRQRLSDELSTGRLSSGLSVRALARVLGVSPERIARAERGEPGALTVDLVARIAPAVGLQLAASLYPRGDPVRDQGHLALLARFRARLAPELQWRTEVPIPISGDLRSGDGVIDGSFGRVLVEAETRIGDIQLVERRIAAKSRDIGADRLILLIADTRHNREIMAAHPGIREQFPIDTRTCLMRLGRAFDPGGDCLVIL